MLSSQLTLDDEDAVQEELKELQNEAVSYSEPFLLRILLIRLY